MTSPKLSICIATYNRGAFIGETLISILKQIQSDVELIVVDGASPDNTSEVMERYLSTYPQIRYFREEKNSGIDRDYDKAVSYATGKYCWLMTDDDLLNPNAISRVLALVDEDFELVVVNSEVRTADLSKVIMPKFLLLQSDQEYDAQDSEKFFSQVANYLSFIGGVVVKRSLWLERNRSFYYGTLFVHVGVIFQNPPFQRVKVIADPLIVIRYGNAMWSSRGFEIWMFKWPQLIWSFNDFSDRAKALVCIKEPWKQVRKLVLYRAIGGYAWADYRRFFFGKVSGLSRISTFIVAIVPASIANFVAGIYCLLLNKNARAGVYDLSRSVHSTWASRLAARIFNV